MGGIVPHVLRLCYPSRMKARTFTTVAICLLTTVLFAGCDVAAPAATPMPGPLVTYAWPYDVVIAEPAWLAAHLRDANIHIVDVSATGQYELGHIPGAVHTYWQDLIEKNADTYGKLAGMPDRERVFDRFGIASADTTVVVYDRGDNRAAARTAWGLWYAGHPNVRLLNGGLAAWAAAGQPLERATHTATPTTYRDLPDESVHANRCDFSHATDGGRGLILDVRTDAEQAETWGGTVLPGSVPGAKRLPWTSFVRSPNVPAFRAPDDLRPQLAATGATPDKDIWLYGLASSDAALPFFALKALGYVHVHLYDGGWAEWGANPSIANVGPPCG